MTPCRARETCLQADVLDVHAQYSQAAERPSRWLENVAEAEVALSVTVQSP
jgi:hypothetical protein